MQYDVKTAKEYLEILEQDWRKEKLKQVRNLIKKHGSDLCESIEYKMLAYGKDGKNIFHLNAQSAYVSLYVCTINKIKDAEEQLKDFDTGKGCIRIKKKVEISETQLEEFIKKSISTY